MRQVPPSKLGAWVMLILATIVALFDALVYIKFRGQLLANNRDFMVTLRAATWDTVLFIGLFIVFFFFSLVSNVKFSRYRRFWGFNFGGFLGRLIILGEYAAYVLAIVFLFV